jgi:hypothetical protein
MPDEQINGFALCARCCKMSDRRCPTATSSAIPERFRAFVAEKAGDAMTRGPRDVRRAYLPGGEGSSGEGVAQGEV